MNLALYSASYSTHIFAAPPQHSHLKYKLLPELGYYKFYDIPTSWYKAEVTCREANGHLLVLNSPKEFTELKKIWDASGVKGDFLHLGINDFDKEKEFVTVLGKKNSLNYLTQHSPANTHNLKINIIFNNNIRTNNSSENKKRHCS
jgi:hypothetical protein